MVRNLKSTGVLALTLILSICFALCTLQPAPANAKSSHCEEQDQGNDQPVKKCCNQVASISANVKTSPLLISHSSELSVTSPSIDGRLMHRLARLRLSDHTISRITTCVEILRL